MAYNVGLSQSANLSWNIGGASGLDGGGGGLPSVVLVTPPSNGTYNTDDVLTFTLQYSGIVEVTGTPYINLTFSIYGNVSAHASYISGTGTDTLTFTYTVQDFDQSPSGITIASSITLNGGTISGETEFTAPSGTGIIVLGYPTVDWSMYDSTDDKSPVVFYSGTLIGSPTDSIRVVGIDETRFIVFYELSDANLKAKIGSIYPDGIVSFGSEASIASSANHITMSLLDSTHAIVGYRDISTGYPTALVFTFSGTTIGTIGTPVTVESINMLDPSLAGMSATEAMMSYNATAATDGHIAYLGISGTTITVGNITTYSTISVNDTVCAALSSSRVLLVTAHGSGVEVQAKLLDVSGTTPNVLSTLTIKDAAITADSVAIGVVNSTKAVVGYTDSFGTKSYAVVVTATADVLAKGTEIQVLATTAQELSIAIPDSNNAVYVATQSNTNLSRTVLAISGTTLTAGSTYTTSADIQGNVACAVGQPFVPVCYMQDDDSDKGKCIVLTSTPI